MIGIYSTGTMLIACFTFIALFSSNDVERLTNEIITMLSFDHPNVMSLIGVCLDKEMPLLIMPFMANGSVLEYVTQHKEDLRLTSKATEAQVCHCTLQIVYVASDVAIFCCRSFPQGNYCLACVFRLPKVLNT